MNRLDLPVWAGNQIGELDMSIFDDVLVISNSHAGTDTDRRPGEVYVYEKSLVDGSWDLVTMLTSGDFPDTRQFGHSVSATEDTIVVGASYKSGHDPGTGAVYVFEKHGFTWEKTQLEHGINPPDVSVILGEIVSVHGSTLAAFQHVANTELASIQIYEMDYLPTCPNTPSCEPTGEVQEGMDIWIVILFIIIALCVGFGMGIVFRNHKRR